MKQIESQVRALRERWRRTEGLSYPRDSAPRAAVTSQHPRFSGGDQNAHELGRFHCPKGISSEAEARLWLDQVEASSLWEAIQRSVALERRLRSSR